MSSVSRPVLVRQPSSESQRLGVSTPAPSSWLRLPLCSLFNFPLQSKLNCEVLWDDFAYEVRWAVAGDSIVLQLVARLENNEYMSFGLSGDKSRSRMVGGDVVVAWVDKESLKGYAKDYYLDAKSQCSGGRGSCPDENIVEGTDSVRLLNAALVNGYSIVTFQRSLKAQDELDKHVFTNDSQPIIWAIGPLNSRKEVSYHSLANKGDIFIDFGRPPKWNCPTPESVPDQPEPEDASASHEHEGSKLYSANIQDIGRRESRPKNQIPTPAPAPKSGAWEIPSIKCYEPEDGVFYAQMGPTGGKHGYSAITGHVGWGISWYINGLLIPEINVVRGRTYTFIVEGGLDPETPARYHPFYITDDPVGGYQYKTPQERANIQIFAGAVQNKRGEVRPTGVGRLCNWTPDPNQPPADEFTSFGAYQRTLRLECDPGNPGIIQWTVEKDTPDTVYYQCYTHRYLGWKINVHDHCEGEAASELVPSIAKAPENFKKPQEVDFESSESINYETRVKPDSQFLKNYLGKNETSLGLNEFQTAASHRPEFFQNYEKAAKLAQNQLKAESPGIQPHVIPLSLVQDFHFSSDQIISGLAFQKPVLAINQQTSSKENKFLKFGSATQAPSLSSYLVSEEPSEEIHHQSFDNFQIIPISLPQTESLVNGFQNQQKQAGPIKNSVKFQEEIHKNFHILKAQAEEKQKRPQKVSHHTKPLNRSPGGQYVGSPTRQRKPTASQALTLQQRPFPPGVFRPPFPPRNSQKRPTAITSQKPSPQKIQAKGPHQHFQDFNRQGTQIIDLINLPVRQQQSSALNAHDLFPSSTIGKHSVIGNVPLALNNGFDPQSVQVEGGFKPILNSAFVPKLDDRVDLNAGEENDNETGVINLIAGNDSNERRSVQETEEKENGDKESDMFKNQKPEMFEPIFIPSFPDESVKKYQEKHGKPLTNTKHRKHQFRISDLQKKGHVYVNIRPTASLIRTPFYPDNVIPPFRIPSQGGNPQLHYRQDDFEENKTAVNLKPANNDTSNEELRAENILEVIEMYEEKQNKTEKGKPSFEGDVESKTKGEEQIQDEIAMADERKDFYVHPKIERFLSYDGKVVMAEEAPPLPEDITATDVSKLPQFVPFKGIPPPLANPVNVKNLPQLRNSKLARSDILPPTDIRSRVPEAKTGLGVLGERENVRRKRSPDHIPGHIGHDHHDHHDHDHHPPNSSASNDSNLFNVALLTFSLLCIRKHIAL